MGRTGVRTIALTFIIKSRLAFQGSSSIISGASSVMLTATIIDDDGGEGEVRRRQLLPS